MSEIEYNNLVFEISTKIGVNQLEKLFFMCRWQISKGSKGRIKNALELFEELENQGYLGIDRLETLKQILEQLNNQRMVEKVKEFENKRKAQSVGIIASFKQAAVNLKGAIKMICNFRNIGGALVVVSAGMALYQCSTLDEYLETFNKVVLPASTILIGISEGSLCFTVQAETPAALKELWDIYKDGTLQRRLQKFLGNDDIKQLTNAEDIEVAVFIDEQEYMTSFNFLQNQVPDSKEERFRRKSDSFFHINSNQREIAMMKLTQAENQLSFERQVHGEEIKKLKEKIILARESRDYEILERPIERRRRNSDSNLYYKARKEEVEQTDNQPERALEGGAQLDFEKRMFADNYLPNIHETHSKTTETSDSGVRALGAISEGEMKDTSGGEHSLYLKDLSQDVIRKLDFKLDMDYTSWYQICESFGVSERTPVLHPWKDEFERLEYFDFRPTRSAFSKILDMFSHVPVKLFKEVLEALQLYDLSDVLDEGKPRAIRSLRPLLSLREIEKLRNSRDRPISYHSSVAVLIINGRETCDTEGIEKFFKGLNAKSEVTVMRCRNDIEAAYTEFLKKSEGEQRFESSPVSLKKAGKDSESEMDTLRSDFSEVIQRWISNQDKYSSVAVFFIFYDYDDLFRSEIEQLIHHCKKRLVTAFPTKVKLTIHSLSSWNSLSPREELFVVNVRFGGEDFLPLMLETLTKRWQTMDLHSMMREFGRSLARNPIEEGDRSFRDFRSLSISDNLPCLVRFIMHEEPTN